MKKSILQDIQSQNSLDKDGFFKFKLFSNGELDELKALMSEFHPEINELKHFSSSTYLHDFKRKEEISNKISEVLSESIAKIFTDYRLMGASFLLKGTGPNSEMPLHQDWTIVDESSYYALNLWIPLTDTTEENGTIEVLPGSHLFNESLRAPSLPFYFAGYEEKIKNELVSISAKENEAVILNQAVIHYSKPNMTETPRPAITAGIISKEAPLIFHYWDGNKNGTIEKFSQEDSFLLEFEDFHNDIYSRPKMGVSQGNIPYQHPKLNDQKFEELVALNPFKETRKKGFFQKLFNA